jgi:hypothetical protein
MRDVFTVSAIYCLLFILLTTPSGIAFGGMTAETVERLHRFFAELIFWTAALYICASGTYGAFVRQNRFGFSQNHPLTNKLCSLMLLISPFLAILWDIRFVFVLLGLLFLSHMRSRTQEERSVDFRKSRALSNIILFALFTLAMMLMTLNNYRVTSIFNLGTVSSELPEISTPSSQETENEVDIQELLEQQTAPGEDA